MIPLKLTLRGFLTYRDEETLNFEDVRTAVIIGDNGHGKSALFDAVTYALFGKHRGSQTRYLVNQECRELAVRFEFEADGRRYRVDRALTLSPRKNGVPAPVATGLVWDGIDWQAVAHGVADCDAWVKDVLGGMTYEICCQSILLRQGAHDMFLSAKPTERQLVLNTLLDFEPYRRLQQAARDRKGQARGAADGIEGRLGDLVAHDPETFERLETGLAGALERSEQAELAQTTAKARLDASRHYWEVETSLKAVAGELQGKQQLLKDAASVRAAHRRRTDLEGAIPLLKAAHDAEVGALAADSAAVAARVALGSLNLEARGE
ncbi:MAG: SMC family ATPase, partial [Candidatus Dormibacteraeota bacterium]|nr:SMC family ATPase [Candidatus Dormibacteraeota bacterium]